MQADRLGAVGIWSRQLRFGGRSEALEAAVELEQLGYGALWIPGGAGGEDLFDSVEAVLGVTRASVVATGILNIWGHEASDVVATQHRLAESFPGRFLLGLGVSHAPLIDAEAPGRYARPLEVMTGFLDAMDAAAGDAGAPGDRVIAALAPRMLALARERTLGSHPYMVPVEHTRFAREVLGPDAILAPEVSVVLDDDPGRAAQIARADLALYLGLPNYVRSWGRLGYGTDDCAGGGSARLVEALYALGTPDRIAERVEEHLAAGADHVCIRVITAHEDDAVRLPRAEWRTLAGPLLGR